MQLSMICTRIFNGIILFNHNSPTMKIQCTGEEMRLTLVCLSLLYVLHYWRLQISQVLTIHDKTCASLALKKLLTLQVRGLPSWWLQTF